MTGLDPASDRILEAAVVITDRHWQAVESWQSAVFQPPEVLAAMNDWCRTQHGESGLTERVPQGISETQLDETLLGLTFRWGDIPVILCGNSIAQDRRFVDRYLPAFSRRLHYRMLDVSSLKILFTNYGGKPYAKRNSHRALDDVEESIAELRHYLRSMDFQGHKQL